VRQYRRASRRARPSAARPFDAAYSGYSTSFARLASILPGGATTSRLGCRGAAGIALLRWTAHMMRWTGPAKGGGASWTSTVSDVALPHRGRRVSVWTVFRRSAPLWTVLRCRSVDVTFLLGLRPQLTARFHCPAQPRASAICSDPFSDPPRTGRGRADRALGCRQPRGRAHALLVLLRARPPARSVSARDPTSTRALRESAPGPLMTLVDGSTITSSRCSSTKSCSSGTAAAPPRWRPAPARGARNWQALPAVTETLRFLTG